jgi:hypothetical protein
MIHACSRNCIALSGEIASVSKRRASKPPAPHGTVRRYWFDPNTYPLRGCRCARCKKANNTWALSRRKARPDIWRGANLRAMYGMSLVQYNQLLQRQRGVCAICKRTESKVAHGTLYRLAVDHNHTTGKIRGLLCFHCNHAVGQVHEDPIIARALLSYIRRRCV